MWYLPLLRESLRALARLPQAWRGFGRLLRPGATRQHPRPARLPSGHPALAIPPVAVQPGRVHKLRFIARGVSPGNKERSLGQRRSHGERLGPCMGLENLP